MSKNDHWKYFKRTVRIFGIFLWHERHRAGIHTACSCTSGATYAKVTRVCSNYISSAEIIHGEKHYLGPLRQMKREPKRLFVKFFKSFTIEVIKTIIGMLSHFIS